MKLGKKKFSELSSTERKQLIKELRETYERRWKEKLVVEDDVIEKILMYLERGGGSTDEELDEYVEKVQKTGKKVREASEVIERIVLELLHLKRIINLD